MSSSTVPTPTRVALDAVRSHEQAVREHEVATIRAVLEWATLCEARTLDEAAHVPDFGEDEGQAVAGVGAPLVRESALAELTVALGRSPEAGRAYLGAVLEVRYRLPRLWEAVASGRCAFWRARQVAERTMLLCEEGAAYVDTHVNGFVHAVSHAQRDRIVEAALARWQPELADERRRAAAEQRGVEVHLRSMGVTGTVQVTACLDGADALDLDTRLQDGARELRLLGSTESLGVRRAQSLGDLARGQATLPAGKDERADGPPTTLPARRAVVLHLHVALAAVTGCGATSDEETLARVGNLRAPVLTEQVRRWCGTAGTITVRPVLDLDGLLAAESYEAPTRLREQIELRDATCVFPHCTRPATRADLDHVVPWPAGPTTSQNLAPLCRRHHRHKTHHGWSYEVLAAGVHLWRSPHGLRSLRLPSGTYDLSEPPPPASAAPPLTATRVVRPPRRPASCVVRATSPPGRVPPEEPPF